MSEPAPTPAPTALAPAAFTFDWKTILLALLPALVPLLVSIVLPLIEGWLGIDLDDAAIVKLITQLIAILIPSAVVGGISVYGLNRWHAASLVRSGAMADVAMYEAESRKAA